MSAAVQSKRTANAPAPFARQPHRAGVLTIALAALLSCALWSSSMASAAPGDDPIKSGRRTLANQPDMPWYDSNADDLRRIDLPPASTDRPSGDAKRQDHSSGKTVSGGKGHGGGAGSGEGMGGHSGSGDDSESSPAPHMSLEMGAWVQWVAWILIAIALVVVAGMLIRAYLKRENKAALSGEEALDEPVQSRGLEDLPFAVRKVNGDLLDEARRQYELGNFREAIIFLYSYQLLQLDRNQLIHLEKGKTNRQYLGEARRRVPVGKPLGQLLEGSMVAFEDVFFGAHALGRERFEQCWAAVPQFHQLIQQAPV